MPTATQDTGVITVRIPTGSEVYDGIMSTIEPDLVSDAIPLIDAKYAGETPEQTAERLARYKAAYAEYDVRFAAWSAELNTVVNQYRKEALKIEEQESKAQENVELSQMESQFTTITSSTPSL